MDDLTRRMRWLKNDGLFELVKFDKKCKTKELFQHFIFLGFLWSYEFRFRSSFKRELEIFHEKTSWYKINKGHHDSEYDKKKKKYCREKALTILNQTSVFSVAG